MIAPRGVRVSGSGVFRGGIVIAATIALALLPVEASRAGSLLDFIKGSSKQDDSSKHDKKHDKSSAHAASSKHASATRHETTPKAHHVKVAALGTANLAASALRTGEACVPAKFRIVIDVGHTAESEGATSARNIPEFSYNLRLAQQIAEKLKAEGFAGTNLLVTEGKAKPSLFKRVAVANDTNADLFLSIHHDSVPDKLLEDWEFEGKKSHYSDRFSGYSVFVSHSNADFNTSFAFAEMVAKEMKARGLHYAPQYTMPVMGHYQHPLLDKETGVYAYDELVVLRKTQMPAVLLEAGSIINRDEELQMESPERRDTITSAVADAMKKFCVPPATSSAAPAIAKRP
jgi:N-acetylmuramoyl-L-alanine amidase